MNFIDLSALNINTELEILKRGTQCNSLFLYQHKGVFFADNSRIGNSNQVEASTKFINVLTKAKIDNIALVLSPEYSCPKRIIDEIIINENMRPLEGKIWVLGGESLNKVELEALREGTNDNIYIYFEDCYSMSDKMYVDPLYYIFNGHHNGVSKLIIIVQFKTKHMGGLWYSQTEPDNLIEGNNIYIIKNNEQSVRLMSLICSEAMNFNAFYEQELINNHSWLDTPYLLLSLQFNPNPSHQNFISFKQFALSKDKRELITLNWGYETTFQNNISLYHENNAPRSGVFFKTSDVELDYRPEKIRNNHYKGFYFLQIKRNRRVYFLNRNTDLFKIENKSVSIVDGVEEQQRREGPTVKSVYNFSHNLTLEEIGTIPDNHITFLMQLGITNAYFTDASKSIIDKERLLNICTGNVKGKVGNNWCDIINLSSFLLGESDECNNRLTYTEDTYSSSEAVRNSNCVSISELDNFILPNNNLYPHSIKRLGYKDLKLAYAEDADQYHYKYNVTNQEGNIEKATICYLGYASDYKVKETYDELQKLFEKGTLGKDTVVVFYKRGLEIKQKSNPEAGNITETPNSNNSIV